MLHDTIPDIAEETDTALDSNPVALWLLESSVEDMQASLDQVASVIFSTALPVAAVQTASALTQSAHSLTTEYLRLRESYEALDASEERSPSFSDLEAACFEVVRRVRLTRNALQTLVPTDWALRSNRLPCFGPRTQTLQ